VGALVGFVVGAPVVLLPTIDAGDPAVPVIAALIGMFAGAALGMAAGLVVEGRRTPPPRPRLPPPREEPLELPSLAPDWVMDPGWYADAHGARRYWDGDAWTEHVWPLRPAGLGFGHGREERRRRQRRGDEQDLDLRHGRNHPRRRLRRGSAPVKRQRTA
jgi:hypothetical protein